MGSPRELEDVPEAQVGSDEDPVVFLGVSEYLFVASSSQTDVANVFGLEASFAKRPGKRTRQVFVYEKHDVSVERSDLFFG